MESAYLKVHSTWIQESYNIVGRKKKDVALTDAAVGTICNVCGLPIGACDCECALICVCQVKSISIRQRVHVQ